MIQRNYVAILFSAALVLGCSAQASAQDNNQQRPTGIAEQSTDQQSNKGGNGASGQSEKELVGVGQRNYLILAQKPSEMLASSLMGMTVRNKAEEIGTIKDLIIGKNNKIVGFVVDMSGITGLIQKSVGISWNAVEDIDREKGVVVVTVSKPQLQDVRSFTTQEELQE